MNEYVCKLGEFSGSDYLEFRKGNSGAGRKFLRQDSLYVLDSAFFFFLERIFREIITSFDMFEDTCVTRREWQEIMHLNIPEIVPSEFVNEAMEMDNEAYVLRPMNCPHHMVMYKNFLHSYKDLPIRIAEIANDFRYEAAGAVKGIERARSFTQNDSHIFCTPEQIETEFKGVLDLIMDVYKDFGFKNYKCRLSLRDPEDKEKYFQDDEMWNNAENDLRKVLNDIGIDYIEAKGEAAFYGPKLDILIKPAIGNEVALSTIQLDFLLPRRFELYYIDANGEKKTPVVIHRAILGSLDRFIAMLLEETKGALPLWLAPVGINIIPVNKEYHLEYATSIYEMLKDANYRVELDDSDEKLSYKMRESQIRKIPITLILGQKEVDEKTISFRLFGSTETTTMSIEEFKKYIENLIVNKK